MLWRHENCEQILPMVHRRVNWIIGSNTAEGRLEFCNAIRLRLITRSDTNLGSKNFAEMFQDLRNELGTSVGENVLRDAI